jgi:hypothetical protein
MARLRGALSSVVPGRRAAHTRSAGPSGDQQRALPDDPAQRIDIARQRLKATIPPPETDE